jgi:uncharacterized protein YjiS (DUF1127 family)
MTKLEELPKLLQHKRDVNETVRQLHGLSPRELMDIGYYGGDIGVLARSILSIHQAVTDADKPQTE